METALKGREGDPLKTEIDQAMKRIGEVGMENEILKAGVEKQGSSRQREAATMSAALSPAAGRRCGAKEACAASPLSSLFVLIPTGAQDRQDRESRPESEMV